jgi:uncharacterized membrane protein YhdT
MEQAKFILELAINGLALFIVFAVLISLIGGAVGFVLWLIDKIREESHGN